MKTFTKLLIGGTAVAGIGVAAVYHQNPNTQLPIPTVTKKTSDGTTTVDQTKTNEELATTVIGLYGANQLKDYSDWHMVEKNFKQPTDLVKIPVDQNTMAYRIIIKDRNEHSAPYYQLSGQNHNQVEFFDGYNNKLLAKSDLETIIKYVNAHYSDEQQKEIATQLKIKYAN
ncbi:hypothetical protein JK159_04500 [Weissella minor]|uniref:hypothetical protein n=1 Tax=Weissella minor TaxID=1620 RepID=UPI001BAF51FF|nr:hypothetical protein [Weissella minor]MBS0949626.1 hypothetical protein [Weissella minor]